MNPMQKLFGRTLCVECAGFGESIGDDDGWKEVSNRVASSRNLASSGRSLDDWLSLLAAELTGGRAHAQVCIATAHAGCNCYERLIYSIHEIRTRT